MFLWGLGDVVGPFISGAAIDIWGAEGLPATGFLVCAVFVVFILSRREGAG